MSSDMSGFSSFRGGRKNKLKSEINVVPYIDVMLVLLVIFMVVSPMTNQGAINLPSAEKSALPPTQYIQISLHPDASFEIGLRDPKQASKPFEKAANRGEVMQKLRTLHAKNPEYPVLISGDRDIRYDEVIQVISETKKLGISRVGLATQ